MHYSNFKDKTAQHAKCQESLGWLISKANVHLLSEGINALCYLEKNSVSMSETLEERSILSFVDFIKSMLECSLICMIRSNKLPQGRNYIGPM